MNSARLLRGLLVAALLVSGAPVRSDSAAALRLRFAALGPALAHNVFSRPLVLESSDTPGRLQGDIYAVLDYPLDAVNTALRDPARWCELMSLHANTKYCRATGASPDSRLLVRVGTKSPQELSLAMPLDFSFSTAGSTAELLNVTLGAESGPLGTSDYRIVLEAVALPDARSFVHLRYAYAYSLVGRMAMQVYLATGGNGKLGFSLAADSTPADVRYIDGIRGLVERNTMRYYLAIDAVLDESSAAPQARFERRLQHWFSAVEQYPLQLHEMDRNTYVQMKRAERLRQQAMP